MFCKSDYRFLVSVKFRALRCANITDLGFLNPQNNIYELFLWRSLKESFRSWLYLPMEEVFFWL